MTIRWNNVGIALAILAGLTTIGFATWPIQPPQGRGNIGALWGVGVYVIGLAFIASVFLANSRPWLTRAILLVGAVLLIGSAITFGQTWQVFQMGPLAAFFDFLPALLALVAAALVGPIQQSPEERRAQQRGRLPDLPLTPEQQTKPGNARGA